jgi:uncharacterized protein YcbX
MALTVVDARNYLIKGCKPHVLAAGEEMHITREGPLHQRRWMVVDAASHIFRSQRHRGFERLTLLQPSLVDDSLRLEMEGNTDTCPIDEHGPTAHVKIWEAMCPAVAHVAASEWLSDQLHKQVLLVRKNAKRPINSIYAPEADTVGFSDRFPLTLLSTTTVERLQAALGEQVHADRFRYNVLLAGCSERDEHHLARFQIGSFIGRGVKPCGRCNTINVDQRTAAVDATILERLFDHPEFYNPASGEVVVSENAIIEREGAFKVSDTVEVLERRPAGWDRPYEPNHHRVPTLVVPLPEA